MDHPLGEAVRPKLSETSEGRRDSLDPENFKYTITAREIKA